MIPAIQDLFATLGPWILVPVFLVVFFESSAFLGLVLPGESMVIVTGAAVGAGVFNPWAGLTTVIIAAVSGDISGFLLGFYFGRRLLSKWTFANRYFERHQEKIEKLLNRWGMWAVFVGRFLSFARAFMPFTAGLFKMPLRRFAPVTSLAAATWAAGYFFAGFLVGEHIQLVKHWVSLIGGGVFGLIAFTYLMLKLWRMLSQPRRREYAVELWRRHIAEPVRARFEALSRSAAITGRAWAPSGYLGIHLLFGMAAIIGLGILFGGITQDVIARAPITEIDRWVAAFAAEGRSPVADRLALALVFLANRWFLAAVAAVVAIESFARRDFILGAVAIASFAGAWALRTWLHWLFQGQIPDLLTVSLVHGPQGFPSMRMTLATATYGISWHALSRRIEKWNWQVLNALGILYLLILIAAAVISVEQRFSSVAAGFALGGCWLAICLTGSAAWRRLKASQPSPRSTAIADMLG